MSVRLRFGVFIASFLLATTSCHAMDPDLLAASSAPTAITLCGDGGSQIKSAVCRERGYDILVAAIDKAFDGALARTPANVSPLLKRDEAWFDEMILQAAATVEGVDDAELRESFITTLRQRSLALDAIAGSFGRSGVSGKWTNAFGNVTLSPEGTGAWRLAIEMRVDYGSDRRRQCRLGTTVTPSGGWLSGTIASATDRTKRPSMVKLRRQGETLRLVVAARDEMTGDREDCDYLWQITGTYFANGLSDATDKTDTAFVAPTFDCARPETATDEEICADPDLAQNDQRLNRAWKALLPRLDEPTRRALMLDQRNWVHTQAWQFPEFLHPSWDKRDSQMHATADARDHVDALQRERIALLEGFDDKRAGLAGVWLAYNAIIKITVDKNGRLTAKGWKWDQGDWKAGCDYEMSGKVGGGVFRSDDRRKNPDTLERDGVMLIVNRMDDVFAKKRSAKDTDDEPKCKRRFDNSSTARLFPARDSPDIDNFSGSIR